MSSASNAPHSVFILIISFTRIHQEGLHQTKTTIVYRTGAAAIEAARTKVADTLDQALDRADPPLSAEGKTRWKDNCIKAEGLLHDGSGWFMKIISRHNDVDCVARVEKYDIQS